MLTSPAWGQAKSKLLTWDFEENRTTWTIDQPRLSERVTSHEVTDLDQHSGKRCERILFNTPNYLENQQVVLRVPPSRVFSELAANLWVRSTCLDVRLGMRIRFPHQIDPRTGREMVLDFAGPVSTASREWQQLTCAATDAAISERLTRARAQLLAEGNRVEIDAREMYVDQLVLTFHLNEGASALQIDSLTFGPVVPPSELVVTQEQSSLARQRLKVFDDRILRDDEPYFPVFTMYHGESLEQILATGVNMLWLPDYTDRTLLTALDDAGIGVLAQPPQVTPEQALLRQHRIPDFEDWTEPIWGWILGFEIPIDDVRYIEAWSGLVRDADRHLRRPILADVAGRERAFHRKVDVLGSSRFLVNSTLSVERHAMQLKHSRNLALPGKPMFTFVQVEPTAAMLESLPEGVQPVIEPEQILHQAYAAIAAGYKGIGFWKQIPLDTEAPGLNERRHAIRLFASHCQILQPWLASGRVVDELPVRRDSDFQQSQTGLLAPLRSRWDTPIEQVQAVGNSQGAEILATVIRSDHGLLILPVWYEPGEQTVPGPQAAQGIRMLLKGDIWQAWEVTPVGLTQSNLEVSWPAGGTEIRLKQFDQHSAIIVTSKPALVERLQQTSRQVRDDSASASVALAALKFQRVQSVHEELVALGQRVPQAELLLRQAYSHLEEARKELARQHPVEAYLLARKSMQFLRTLQRAYWEAAMAELPTVATSLHASSFQTLPEHWRLLEEIGKRTRTSENLLPSGSFENADEILRHWRDASTPAGKRQIQLQHDPIRNDHHLSLQLESESGESAAIILNSPEVAVSPGDIVMITAQVRGIRPFSIPEGEFLLFDTYIGKQGAFRLTEANNQWQTVKLIRQIHNETTLRIRLELREYGGIDIDDLRIHKLTP